MSNKLELSYEQINEVMRTQGLSWDASVEFLTEQFSTEEDGLELGGQRDKHPESFFNKLQRSEDEEYK